MSLTPTLSRAAKKSTTSNWPIGNYVRVHRSVQPCCSKMSTQTLKDPRISIHLVQDCTACGSYGNASWLSYALHGLLGWLRSVPTSTSCRFQLHSQSKASAVHVITQSDRLLLDFSIAFQIPQGIGVSGMIALPATTFAQIVPSSGYGMMNAVLSCTLAIAQIIGPLMGVGLSSDNHWR